MANRKVDKAFALREITRLREDGEPVKVIAAAIGLSKTQTERYISAFQIKRCKKQPKCPHCGVAINELLR